MENMAPFQNLFGSAAMKPGVRFICGCLLVLPTAALMGASFPLIASALDRGDPFGESRWPQAYSANLVGAFLAALITPVAVMPVIGLRGAFDASRARKAHPPAYAGFVGDEATSHAVAG